MSVYVRVCTVNTAGPSFLSMYSFATVTHSLKDRKMLFGASIKSIPFLLDFANYSIMKWWNVTNLTVRPSARKHCHKLKHLQLINTNLPLDLLSKTKLLRVEWKLRLLSRKTWFMQDSPLSQTLHSGHSWMHSAHQPCSTFFRSLWFRFLKFSLGFHFN